VSSVVGNGAGRTVRGSYDNERDSLVPHLSCPDDGYREAHRGADRVEIRFALLLRYLLAPMPHSSLTDVPLHAGANVYLDLKNQSQSTLNMKQRLSQEPDEPSQIYGLPVARQHDLKLQPCVTGTRSLVLESER
jgi:hypothetical protein